MTTQPRTGSPSKPAHASSRSCPKSCPRRVRLRCRGSRRKPLLIGIDWSLIPAGRYFNLLNGGPPPATLISDSHLKALIETANRRTERVFLAGVELKSRTTWEVQDSMA